MSFIRNASWRNVAPCAVATALCYWLSGVLLDAGGYAGGGGWLISLLQGVVSVAAATALFHPGIRRIATSRHATGAARREEAIREELARRATNDGVWDWSPRTGEVFFSTQCRAILGLGERDAPAGIREWWERVQPEDRPATLAEFEQRLAGSETHGCWEHRVRAGTGPSRWVRACAKVVEPAESGLPGRVLGVVADITEERTARDHAAGMLALNNAVLQSSPIGVISYRLDGTTVSANPAAAHIVGTIPEVLLGLNFRELESWRKYGVLDAAERAIATKSVVELTTEMVTTFGRRCWLALRFAPFSHQGEERLLLVLIDETEKRRAQEEVHLIHSALHAAPVAWLITDEKGGIQWVNPAFTRLTGYTPAEAIGQNPRILRSGQHSADYYRQLWGTITRGEVWDGVMQNRRKDGTLYHEHMVIAPVRNGGGAIAHFVAMKQDVTNERELEGQLNRAQRLESIGMLASGIAHDLNNVLAPIVLSMELLKLKFPETAAQAPLLVVEQAAHRGVGIVRQVLTFARGLDGERGEVSVRSLIKDVARLIEETFPRNIQVLADVSSAPPPVSGDVTQLHQVLLNLAVNARDAMPEGGTLTLRAFAAEVDEARAKLLPKFRPGKCVALVVGDSGTGIAPDVLERIFDPFFTTKPRGKGTGLGLSTVHGIVRSHGGAIEVKSALGEGTVFTVLLPAIEPGTATAAAEPETDLAGAGRRILLVDDEPAVLEVAGKVLRRHGFEVHLATDCLDALALFQRWETWDLAIVDQMMPGVDGLGLARMLRQRLPMLPVIVISGMIQDPSAAQSFNEGMAEIGLRTFLSKPFTERQLLAAIACELPHLNEEEAFTAAK